MSTATKNQDGPIQPYLVFGGRCEEAIEFYRKALGAEVEMMLRFKESPDPCPGLAPGTDNKIMHSSFRVGGSTIMASDGMCTAQTKFDGFSLSYSVPNEAVADRVFAALSEGGQVQMPLGKTFFSPRFGVVSDRFGVSWMVIVPAPMG
jgi:PhnB protein